MTWLDLVPKLRRRLRVVAITVGGGVAAVMTRSAWGVVVMWAGVSLAFADFLSDNRREPASPSDGQDRDWPF